MYSEIKKTWILESENSQLQKIEPSFYSKAGEYLKKIKQKADETNNTSASLASLEYKRANSMLEEILKLRTKKIFKAILNGKNEVEFLTLGEKELYNSLNEIVNKFIEEIQTTLHGEKVVLHRKDETKDLGSSLIRILQDLPLVMGTDLKVYGPFRSEDVVVLPRENAQALIEREVAVEIKI